MNNTYFFSALCIITLIFAPACKKKHPAPKKNDLKTTIDISDVIVKIKNKESVAKF